MTRYRTLGGWVVGALLLAGTVAAQDDPAGHAPAAAKPSTPAAGHERHDHDAMHGDPRMPQRHDEHMKRDEGRSMPGAPAGDGHAHHGAAPVTEGPWSYKGRQNPAPHTAERWEMVPANPRTGMYVAADRVSEAERCRMLREADHLAVDRATRAACGMTAQAAPGAGTAPSKASAPSSDGHAGHHSAHHPQAAPDRHEHWNAPPEAAARPNPVRRTPQSVAQGRRIFAANCASCHGTNAQGDGPVGRALDPKPTNLQAMAGHHPDGDFAWKIEHGRGPMPAWKGVLSAEQIWHVVNYIKSLESAPAKPTPASSHDHSQHQH